MLTWIRRQSRREQAFGPGVRDVLGAAVEAARRLGHNYVGTEHILLAMLARGDVASAALLGSLGVPTGELAARLEGTLAQRDGPARSGSLPYTSQVLSALQLAQAAARDLNASPVGTEHLLLGLLEEGSSASARALTGLGATPAALRALLGPGSGAASSPADGETVTRPTPWQRGGSDARGPTPAPSAPSARSAPIPASATDVSALGIEIDDASSRSIYEQIIAGLQESVATGRLRPGERLPTVRRLADVLDIAPGTVARAYRELERTGVLVTDGARGTRVADRHGAAVPAAARPEALLALMRDVAITGYHLGAAPAELRGALDAAMNGIFDEAAGGA